MGNLPPDVEAILQRTLAVAIAYAEREILFMVYLLGVDASRTVPTLRGVRVRCSRRKARERIRREAVVGAAELSSFPRFPRLTPCAHGR